ncbi:MAG: DCC1-like thiol-disulfide oxidoreductase family protein [Patescibacteria group bacterium]
MTSLKKKPIIAFDGTCPMCTVVVDTIDSSSQVKSFEKQDTNSGPEILYTDISGNTYRGSHAILKILAHYPRFKWVAQIGSLPIIRNILSIGYKLVAHNRHFIFGPTSTLFWVKNSIAVATIIGLLGSIYLWIGERTFPYLPVVKNTSLSYPFDVLLFIIILISLLVSLFSAYPKKYLLISGAGIIIFALFDQARWHPWVYQYVWMIGILALFSWKHSDTENHNSIIKICQLIIGSIYIWSGIQKINPSFILEVFPWLVQPITQFLPNSIYPVILLSSVFTPFIELGIGLALLSKKFRKIGIIGAISMHLLILTTLGPLGHGVNAIIWPWNIVMIVLVLILFSKSTYSFRDILLPKKGVAHKVSLVTFLIIPFFSFIGIWDSYLSFALYSGNAPQAHLYVSDAVKPLLPSIIQANTVALEKNGMNEISIYKWSMQELNVPQYPEERIYRNVAKYVCLFATKPSDVQLSLVSKRNIFTGERTTKEIECSSMFVTPLSSNEYIDFKNKLLGILATSSPREAMSTLLLDSKTNPEIARSCHSFAHAIGHGAYLKYKDFSEALVYLNEACNSGYIHGVIEEYFIQTEDDDAGIEGIKKVCGSYPQGTFKSWQCYHGTGHGFMFYTENDLPKSLEFCSTFSSNFAEENCMNGVLMENFNTTDKMHPSLFIKPDSYYPCDTSLIADGIKDDCYAYAPSWFLSQHPNDYSLALQWCQTVDTKYRGSCYFGVGNQAAKDLVNNPKEVENICNGAPILYKQSCIIGMSQMQVLYHASPTTAREVCSILEIKNQNYCYKTVESTEYLFK